MCHFLVAIAALCAMVGVSAQAQPAEEWRAVAPENLLVIDTSKGRLLAELTPVTAPQTAERVRILANQGFYDGVAFHRVIPDFMAQTGDPDGDGLGGSELPNVPGEFVFRRGLDHRMTAVSSEPSPTGLMGVMPIISQPDAQMMITADQRVAATPRFCPGVLGFARTQDPNSGNSQWFIMTGTREQLNGGYAAFGRVVSGLEVARQLKVGAETQDGRVTDDPDSLVRVRTADQLPLAERPSVRVLLPDSAHFTDMVEVQRKREGLNFSACSVLPVSEVTGD